MVKDEKMIEEVLEELEEELFEEDASEDQVEENEAEKDEASNESPEEELLRVRKELSELREELRKKDELQERLTKELGEFSELFPETQISEIPDDIWESVKKGIPLAAAYALYEKKAIREKEKIAKVNSTNASMSSGAAGSGTSGEYFTPDEVRAMSRSEVRANYSKIIQSMKKWN